MPTITAIVLTFNEEKHIARCIASLQNVCTRICVVDSFSTDKTVEIAKAAGVDVYQNRWINYSSQFTWALKNCNIESDWTMRVDADEYLEEGLILSIKKFIADPAEENSAFFRRKIVFLGQPITHGFFYPAMMLRLWRTGQGRIETRWMDEHILVTDAKTRSLCGDLVDENLNDLAWWANKHIGYAQREVYDIVESAHNSRQHSSNLTGQAKLKRLLKTKVYSRMPITIRGSLYFLYRFVIGRGFLDGKSGFFFHFLQAFWYRVFVDAKLYELEIEAKAMGLTPYELLQQRGIYSTEK